MSGRAASPTTSELLQTYEPVLLFHPAEEWAPEAVESYLQLAKLEQQPRLRYDLPCPLRGGIACYRALPNQSDWNHPVVYGTVVTVPPGSTPPPGFTSAPKLLVHYWLFYALDDWRSAHARLWQAHEGDWESITIGIDQNDQPSFAAYSEHCSGSVRPWSAVTKRAQTHPVAYVALGSHANWFMPASANTRFSECLKTGLGGFAARKAAGLIDLAQEAIVDHMGAAHPLGPAGLAGVTPLEVVPLVPATTPWARFAGRWGEGQILWLGSKPRSLLTVSQGFGPSTPHWFATTVSASWHPATG